MTATDSAVIKEKNHYSFCYKNEQAKSKTDQKHMINARNVLKSSFLD